MTEARRVAKSVIIDVFMVGLVGGKERTVAREEQRVLDNGRILSESLEASSMSRNRATEKA